MTKTKKDEETGGKGRRVRGAAPRPGERAPDERAAVAGPVVAGPVVAGKEKTPARARAATAPSAGDGGGLGAELATITTELRALRGLMEPRALRSAPDDALEAAVDSLRRLLSELIERRLESVVEALVEVRHEAASSADGSPGRALARLDRLLRDLGALRFEAEPMDIVDPLIHAVIGERRDAALPDGVILEAAHPGFRSARGLVLCKAAVVVNRRG